MTGEAQRGLGERRARSAAFSGLVGVLNVLALGVSAVEGETTWVIALGFLLVAQTVEHQAKRLIAALDAVRAVLSEGGSDG